jgi:hypothetical protein
MPLFPPASSGGGVATEDEGVPLGTTASLNFTGAGVTASGINPTVVNIPGGGAGSVTQVAATITLPYNNLQFDTATVVDANISGTSKVITTWGNVLDTDVNGPDMAAVNFSSIPAAGSMTVQVSAAAPNTRVGGPYKINYLIG